MSHHLRNLVSWRPFTLIGIRHSLTVAWRVNNLREQSANVSAFRELAWLGQVQGKGVGGRLAHCVTIGKVDGTIKDGSSASQHK